MFCGGYADEKTAECYKFSFKEKNWKKVKKKFHLLSVAVAAP
jgi:hypothetical protein